MTPFFFFHLAKFVPFLFRSSQHRARACVSELRVKQRQKNARTATYTLCWEGNCQKRGMSVAQRLSRGSEAIVIASRLSRAKIKCSICSSQFNTWDAQHRWALVLIVCLNRGRRFKARFVAPTGCPGIAVPPGSAHARPWRVSIAQR